MPLFTPGPSTTQGTASNQRDGHLAELAGHRRDRRADGDAGRSVVGDVQALEVEELGEQHGVLVGGAVGDGGQPPVVGEAAARLVLRPDAEAGVARRQRRAFGRGQRVQPDDRLGVPDVDGEQHPLRSSPRSVTSRRSRPRSRTGAEWVRAPDRDQVHAGRRVGRRGVAGRRRPRPRPGRRPRRPSGRASAAQARDLLGRHVVEQHRGGPGPAGLATWSGRSHSTSTIRPGHIDRARCTASVIAEPARWLSLTSTASERLARWLWPPPARTAAFSRARSPGVVLRVSSTRTAGFDRGDRVDEPPGQRGHPREVAEEVEGRALGGEDRPERAGDLGHDVTAAPPASRPDGARPPTRAASTEPKASSAQRCRPPRPAGGRPGRTGR